MWLRPPGPTTGKLAVPPDQHPVLEPNLGFFTSGAFIGDYNGVAASNRAVYPV
jgi:hypothetical protein